MVNGKYNTKEEKHWLAVEDFEPLTTYADNTVMSRQTGLSSKWADKSNVQKLRAIRVTTSWCINPNIDTGVGVSLDW